MGFWGVYKNVKIQKQVNIINRERVKVLFRIKFECWYMFM